MSDRQNDEKKAPQLRATRPLRLSHYDDPEYYDYAYLDREEDLTYYCGLAESCGGPVLELGAGTGRISLAIAKSGIDVTALETHPAMLRALERAVQNLPSHTQKRVHAVRGDFRSFRFDKRFALIIAPFNAFMHLQTVEDFQAMGAAVKTHLLEGGQLAFDVLMPDFEYLALTPEVPFDGGLVSYPGRQGRFRYREQFSYNHAQQTQHIEMIFTPEKGGTPILQSLTHRYFFPQELHALLRVCGFDLVDMSADFSGVPLDEDTESIVVKARPS